MKRKFWLMALLLAVLLSAGAAWADGDFYVIASGGAAVGTRISSLPYTISNPGFYYLSGNLTYNGSGNAITVSADNVTIDLMGFSLTNSGTSAANGIYMNGRTNVEIRNGTVSGFSVGTYSVGILEEGSSGSNHRAVNVRATSNSYGIFLNGINHLIKSCDGSNNTATGLGSNSGTIADCMASNNAYGILLYGAGNILGNTTINNSVNNFYLGNGEATSIMVDRNSAYGLTPSNNYYIPSGTTGLVGLDTGTKTNAGAP